MRTALALGITLAAAIASTGTYAQDVPDALAVEWNGKKPCEKLFEDDKIRVLRCIFGPTEVHVRHRHPPNLVYTLSGGKVRVEDGRGIQRGGVQDGQFIDKRQADCP